MSGDLERYLPLLLARLQQLDLYKVTLFGSYTCSTPIGGRDIDLFVVLNIDELPESYREKSDLYLQAARVIRDIRQQVSVDLVVQTKGMYKKFIKMDSLFARELQRNGKIIFEAEE